MPDLDIVAPPIPHLDVLLLAAMLMAVGKVADLEDRSVPLWILLAIGLAGVLWLILASSAASFLLAGIITFIIMTICKAREGPR